MSYGKIFESLFTGSMVGSGTDVFAVWAYCIANAKPPGTIELNPRILAAILGCEQDRVDAAIHVLTSPDEYSRTEIEQGRRLVQEGKFLYRMPTWETYNKIKNEVERREQNRRHQQAYRDRRKGVSADVSDVRLESAQSAHVDVDVDVDVDQSQSTPPTPQGGSSDSPVRKKRLTAAELPEDFVRFLAAYGRGENKRAALSIWTRLSQADRAAAMAAVPTLVAARPDEQFRKTPDKWLRHRCWEDEIVVPTSQPLGANGRPAARTSMTHIPNMPLGHETCQCDGCVSYRAKRVEAL